MTKETDMQPTDQLAYILPTVSSVVDRIEVMQMNDPTPCDAFTVHGIIEHMMVLGATFTYWFRGEEAPELTPPAVYGWVPAAEFREVMDDLLDAVKSPGAMERTIDSPVGAMSGEQFARFVAFDGLVHGWDLAVSTGQRFELPPTVIAAVDEFAQQALTDELRDGETFKTPTGTRPNATPIERIAAFSGRSTPIAA